MTLIFTFTEQQIAAFSTITRFKVYPLAFHVLGDKLVIRYKEPESIECNKAIDH